MTSPQNIGVDEFIKCFKNIIRFDRLYSSFFGKIIMSDKLIGDESVLFTVSKIMSDKRVCELMDENKNLKDRLKVLEDAIKTTCGHSWELVWYARSRPGECEDGKLKVEQKYPKEVKKLIDDDTNWQHGFNSGLLAVSNLVKEIIHADETVKDANACIEDDEDHQPLSLEDYIDQIVDEFPMLDT